MQMEVLEEQHGQSGMPIDFIQFIKNVQSKSQKSLLNKRNRQIIRERNKQNWFIKSKIIPPSFQKIGSQKMKGFKPIGNILHQASFFDSFKDNEKDHSLDDIKPSRKTEGDSRQRTHRRQSKNNYKTLQGISSCRKSKSNWKLEFRRDELNLLRYRADEQNNSPLMKLKNQKTVRLLKVPKKFEQIKTQFQPFKTNFDALTAKNIQQSSAVPSVNSQIRLRTVFSSKK